MGLYFTDKYSLLHVAVGIVVYYWNMSFVAWFIIHLLFEYVENTVYGMKLINGSRIGRAEKTTRIHL